MAQRFYGRSKCNQKHHNCTALSFLRKAQKRRSYRAQGTSVWETLHRGYCLFSYCCRWPLQWPGCVLRIVRLLCVSLPCKFKSWNTSSRSVRKTSSVLLGKDKILYAGFPFHKLHTLSLYILFNQTYISCFKQQLQRTFKYLKTKRCRKDKLAPSYVSALSLYFH